MSCEKNKPVVLFPLRLEIYDHVYEKEILVPGKIILDPGDIGRKIPGRVLEKVSEVTLNEKTVRLPGLDKLSDLERFPGRKPPLRRITVEVREVLVRWYPDACQVFPVIGEILPDEIKKATRYAEMARSGIEQDALQRAWDELVRDIGLNKARYLVDCIVNGLKPMGDKGKSLNLFLDRGAALKMLPQNVALFTVHYKVKTEDVPKTVYDSVTHKPSQTSIKEVADILLDIRPLETGAAIPRDISVSAPEAQSVNSQWMTDFEAAVRDGMGVTITDTAKISQIEDAHWLVAVGFDDGVSKQELIEELLLRFKANGGLDILAQDTPTNNTKDQKTGYAKNEYGTKAGTVLPEARESGAVDCPDSGSILSAALGVNPRIFGGLKNTTLTEQSAALAVDRVLWRVCTGGYRDWRMVYDTSVKNGKVSSYVSVREQHMKEWEILTEHFNNYVVGRGVTPAVRLGDNPYGVLPVTSLSCWESNLQDERGVLLGNVKRLCMIFKQRFLTFAVPELSGVGVPPSDTEFDRLIKTLQANAIPARIDTQVISYSDGLKTDPMRIICPVALKEDVGRAYEYYISIQKCEYMKETNKVVEEMWREMGKPFIPGAPDNKVSILLRVFQQHVLKLHNEITGIVYDKNKTEPEKIQLIDEIKRELPEILRGMKELLSLSLDAEQLGTLVREFMDCLSSRLDAWISSLANSNLFEIINRKKLFNRNPALNEGAKETLTGVYGWLEKPLAKKEDHKADGYFQAPSLNQAAAGAVLRNAALVNKSPNSGAFQVNLTSERVKMAIWFIEGLQKGYPAAELFGYRVERGLHEQGLDKYLPDLRDKFLLESQGPEQGAKASRIVNGDKFTKLGDAQFEQETASLGLTAEEKDKLKGIRADVKRMKDAVADLYLAESVYQSVTGNAPRAAAWMEAAEGKIIPPQPEVVKTARTGHSQAQKVFWPMDGNLTEKPDIGATSPRSIAEPVIADFCEKHFRTYDQIRFTAYISEVDENQGPRLKQTAVFYLKKDLGMDAIDLVIGGTPELNAQATVYIVNKMLVEKAMGYTTWDFAGKDFFACPNLQNLQKKVMIEIKYECVVGSNVYYTDVVDKASGLNLFIKSVQPLQPEDMCFGALNTSRMLDIKTDILARLTGERMEFLVDSAVYAFKKLSAIMRDVKAMNAQSRAIPGELYKQLQDALYHSYRHGFKEAMTLLPGFGNAACIEDTVRTVDAILEKISARLPDGASTGEVVLEAGGGKIVVAFVDGKISKKEIETVGTQEKISYLPITEEGLKLAAANRLIAEQIKRIQKLSSEAVPVFPSFSLDVGFSALAADPSYRVCAMEEALGGYRSARKGINAAFGAFPDSRGRLSVFSRLGVQKSLPEIRLRAMMNASLLEQGDIVDFKPVASALYVAGLVTGSTPARRVWDVLDKTSKDRITSIANGAPISSSDSQELTAALNRIIAKSNFHQAAYFTSVQLNAEAAALLDKGISRLAPFEIFRLNRYLLEAAFPGWMKGQKTFDQLAVILQGLTAPSQSFTDFHFILPAAGLEFRQGDNITGFKVDEWADYIPSKEETPPVAFNFKTPRAQAPQAILIAVTPKIEDGVKWTVSDLAQILAETIELMQLRSVPNERILSSSLGYIFPAMLFKNPSSGSRLFPCEPVALEDAEIRGNYFYKK